MNKSKMFWLSIAALSLSAIFNGISDRIIFLPDTINVADWLSGWLLGNKIVESDFNILWDGWHFFKTLEFTVFPILIVFLLNLNRNYKIIFLILSSFVMWLFHELMMHWI